MIRTKDLKEWPMCSIALIVFLQRPVFESRSFVVRGQRSSDQDDWSLKDGVPQWDIFPGPTELRLIGWFDRINLDPKIQIKYIDTKNQLADILTKGNLTRDEWHHLLSLFNISHFQFYSLLWNNGEKISTRFSRRTSHSKIATNDEPLCKGAIERIILDFSKPGEEKLWKSKSLEYTC